MKTFEERYTAWIDGQLEGSALTAFEQELARRATQGEAAADKEDTVRLRLLLQDHFQAPSLTNPDFFSHQLRERIDAERAVSNRGRETKRGGVATPFVWGLARLVGLGSLSLFAAAAIYYGMMPPHAAPSPGSDLANRASSNSRSAPDHGAQIAASASAAPQASIPLERSADPGYPQFVQQLAPTPVPIDLSADIKAHVPDQPANPTTVTPLHYNKPNVNVLWLNGLEYLPNVSETSASPAATATPTDAAPAPAPSASINP